MTIDETIRGRRTVHNFLPRPVPDDVVEEAIRSAIWAPNHKLTEPWRFILIGDDTAEQMAVRNSELVRIKRGEPTAALKLKRWRSIPGWMVLTCRRNDDPFREKEDYAACCCAAQNWMLSLWDKGVGTKWGTGVITRDDAFFELVGINPQEEFVVGLFQYGYPEVVKPSVRKRFDATIHRVT